MLDLSTIGFIIRNKMGILRMISQFGDKIYVSQCAKTPKSVEKQNQKMENARKILPKSHPNHTRSVG